MTLLPTPLVKGEKKRKQNQNLTQEYRDKQREHRRICQARQRLQLKENCDPQDHCLLAHAVSKQPQIFVANCNPCDEDCCTGPMDARFGLETATTFWTSKRVCGPLVPPSLPPTKEALVARGFKVYNWDGV
jgi:hypothetical protein